MIRGIEQLAVIVEPVNFEFGLRDSDGEVYLATAAAGGAVLITGNIRDFTEPRYGSVEVLVAARFSQPDGVTVCCWVMFVSLHLISDRHCLITVIRFTEISLQVKN